MNLEPATVGAVDIGGTKIAVGIVDRSGKVLAARHLPSGPQSRYSESIVSITEALRSLAAETGATLGGIGIGSTGPVHPLAGTFGEIDFLPHWHHANPVADLAKTFRVSVALENDADAGALGEAAWGIGAGKKRLIYVSVGTGIGGGIVLDGHLYRGVDGSHPEIGHQVIDFSGPPCSCGLQGCWEALASGPAMAQWFNDQNAALHPEYSTPRNAHEIFMETMQHNDLAQRAVAREALYLGLGISNLINNFCPDAVVLGGSILKSADLFLPDVKALIAKGCRFVPAEKCEILVASLGDHSNLIGAAQVWYHRFRYCKTSK